MKTRKLIWYLYPSYIVVVGLALGLIIVYASSVFKEFYVTQVTNNLKFRTTVIEKQVLKSFFSAEARDEIEKIGRESGTRLTLVDMNGKVLADSGQDARLMNNHANRPEISRAMQGEFGHSMRHSHTLGTTMLYVAKPVMEGNERLGIIRAAIPITELDQVLASLTKRIAVSGVIICLFSILIVALVTRKITHPIAQLTKGAEEYAKGNLAYPLPSPSISEFHTLSTSFHHMAEELDARLANLKKMEVMRSQFVGNVSHELKTPITLIKGFLETLSDGASENAKDRERFLSIIYKHTLRLETIIEDLLSLSEIEAYKDQTHISLGRHRLSEVVLEAVSDCQESAKKRGVSVECDLDEQLLGNINPSLLEQAVNNLIENAIKYSPKGDIVTVRLARKGKKAEIAVSDHGQGIDSSHLGRLFERFYRVDPSRSREMGGTGLGLAIVKHIAQAHNGEVDVESELGAGTTFMIRIPVVKKG